MVDAERNGSCPISCCTRRATREKISMESWNEPLFGESLLAPSREVELIAAGVEHDIVRGARRLGAQVLHQSVEVDGVVPELFVVGVGNVDGDQIVDLGIGVCRTMP